MSKELTEGWVWFINTRKAHYVKESKSLCRRYMYLGSSFEQGKDDSPDNCSACKKKLAKLKAKEK